MATKVFMEALSPTMEEGRLVKWLKNEGDAVKSGETLAEVETDKAIMELVARGDGVLRKRLLAEGEARPVGQLDRRDRGGRREHRRARRRRRRARRSRGCACASRRRRRDGRRAPARARSRAHAAQAQGEASTPPQEKVAKRSAGGAASRPPTPAAASRRPNGGRTTLVAARAPTGVRARPRPAAVQGIGPGGRIIKRDVEAAVASARLERRAAAASVAASPIARRRLPTTSRSRRSARRSRGGSSESIGPIPDVLPHGRVRPRARRRDAHRHGGDGRRVQGLVQRHRAEGRRHRARAASRSATRTGSATRSATSTACTSAWRSPSTMG